MAAAVEENMTSPPSVVKQGWIKKKGKIKNFKVDANLLSRKKLRIKSFGK